MLCLALLFELVRGACSPGASLWIVESIPVASLLAPRGAVARAVRRKRFGDDGCFFFLLLLLLRAFTRRGRRQVQVNLATKNTTYDAWRYLVKKAQKTIDIAAFYVTLTAGMNEPSINGGYQGNDFFNDVVDAVNRGVTVSLRRWR